jgi:membrane-associated protein
MEIFSALVSQLYHFIDVILHINVHLNEWIQMFGPWIYVILFLIIFCETGLVITPFLPGDSLLFALGALTMVDNAYLQLPILCVTLITAAIIGDAVNYSIGKYAGHKLFANKNSKIFRQEYLDKTHRFYEKYGGKTIILARYVPIVRTFAPFVAGMSVMTYRKFAIYNVVGAVVWVTTVVGAGVLFGNIPWVKKNFSAVVLAIIVISVLPMVFEIWKARRELAHAKAKAGS